MNLVVVAAVGAAAFCTLWAGQSVVLWWIGAPLAWPLRFETKHPAPRQAVHILVPTVWILAAVVTPLWLGSTLSRYYGPMFAAPRWPPLVFLAAYIIVGTCLLHATGFVTGYIHAHRAYPPERLRRELVARIFLIPLPAAFIEEIVFRCVLLNQLLIALPPTVTGTLIALVVSSAVFSAVHFLAPKPFGESKLLAASGLFFAGCAFGAAYIHGGRSLWPALALHAAGIACTEAPRVLTQFERRGRWLVGTREFPHGGLIGTIAMIGLTTYLLTH